MHVIELVLPPAEEDQNTEVVGELPDFITAKFEPVGRWYEALCRRRKERKTLSHHSLDSESSDEDVEEEEEDEEDERLLSTLDPKDWKTQDHYKVLGIAKLRYRASSEAIKRAYKRKVLRHHPDKRRARGVPVKEGEEDYFTCITRAWETLGVATKRRSYDSIDPEFDDTVPSVNTESKENFFKIFGPVIEANARWSVKKNVPMLGDTKADYDSVNHFYSFWYDFESWREYSYLDEEEKEKGENRDERRWIEKQNKAARKDRKKEETARIRQLVDNAYACDPRIARFKEEEKQKKLAEKQARKDAIMARAKEEERIKREALEEERRKKEKEDEEAKAQAAAAKKEKEAQKKLLKKEKKTLRTSMKDFEYFAKDDNERVTIMQEVDKLAELLSLTKLQTLNESLTCGDPEKAKTAFFSQASELQEQLDEEKRRQLELTQRQSSASSESKASKSIWGDEETQALIKAVNLFPAGTVARWETVANFIMQHVAGSKRNAKEVLAKAKDLQKLDTVLKEDANKKAYQVFTKDAKSAASDNSPLSERYESVAEQQVAQTGTNPAPWTAEEQKILEQSLRTFPASTAERWERIAETLPARSKKDCMIRYKELVEMVKAKKAAQAAVKSKK